MNTRSDEITEAARQRANQYDHPVQWNDVYRGFISGAVWSDENPKKNLIDIDEACEWLMNNTMSELNLNLGNTLLVKQFVDVFKDAMIKK